MFDRLKLALEIIGYNRAYQAMRQQGFYKEAESLLPMIAQLQELRSRLKRKAGYKPEKHYMRGAQNV